MSLVIRLANAGRRGERKYRIVVKERRSKRDGRPVDQLGTYEKTVSSKKLNMDEEKFNYWKSKGAQISSGVTKILAVNEATKQ